MKPLTKKVNFKKLIRRNAPAESTVVLFGNAKNPELKSSINKVAITGRKTELETRPSFDTGLGKCGDHLCSCKTACKKMYSPAFEGDQGSSLGMAY
jgi:hypothetical protein